MNFGDKKMKEYKFEVYKDMDGQYRFRVLAPNGRITADSGEGYRTKFFCIKNIKKLQKMLPTAKIIEI
jgi:uncharacterized protein YegP (UPF0339 family)